MNLRRWTLVMLLAGWAVAAQAQDTEPDEKRWTVRYFGVLDAFNDFNGQGSADYLDDNDFGAVYAGSQAQYLYGGKAEIGPYTSGDRTLEADGARLDQFTVGPVVAVNF